MSRPTTPTSEFLSNLESFLKKFKLTTENHKDQEILTLANLDSGRIRKFIVKKVDERSLFGRRNSQKSLKDENENKSRKNSFRKKKEKKEKESKRKLSSSSLHSLKKEKKEGKRRLSSGSLHSLKMSCNIKRFGSSKSLTAEVKSSPTEKKKRRPSFGSGKFKLGWGSSSESDSDDVFDNKDEKSSINDATSDITDPGFTNEALVKDTFEDDDEEIPTNEDDTENDNMKVRNDIGNSDTDSISSMETDSPSSSPRFNLKMSPIPKRNKNKRVEPSYSPVSFRGGYQSNRSSISSVRKGILKKTNSCTTINMEMNNLSRPQTPTENKSIESFEEAYSNGDTTRFTRSGDNPHLRHQRSFNRVKFILDSGRPDNITGDYDDIKIEKNDKTGRTDKGKILVNTNEKRLTRSGKKCLIFSAGILIMSMAVVVGSLYGSRKALKALPENDSDRFVASALEGKFKISNENFVPVLYNSDTEEFKKLSRSLEEFIVKAIFVEESVNEANSTIKLRIVKFEKGSVICIFRIKWHQDQKLELADIRKRLWDHLDKYGAFGEYKVDKHSLSINELKDLCDNNTQGCSHICLLSEETLLFDCLCPDNLIMFNSTHCISPKPSTTTTTTAKNPVVFPPIINKILKESNADIVSVNQETVPGPPKNISNSTDDNRNDTNIKENVYQDKTVSLTGNSTEDNKEESQHESPEKVEPIEEKDSIEIHTEKDLENGILENETATDDQKKTHKTKYADAVNKNIMNDLESRVTTNKTEENIAFANNESKIESVFNSTLDNDLMNYSSYNNSITQTTKFPQMDDILTTHNDDPEYIDAKTQARKQNESNLNETIYITHQITTESLHKNDIFDENLLASKGTHKANLGNTELPNSAIYHKTFSTDQKIDIKSVKITNNTINNEKIEISDLDGHDFSTINPITNISESISVLPSSSKASGITNYEPNIEIITLSDKNLENFNNISTSNDNNTIKVYEYELEKSHMPENITFISQTIKDKFSINTTKSIHLENKNRSKSDSSLLANTFTSSEYQVTEENEEKHLGNSVIKLSKPVADEISNSSKSENISNNEENFRLTPEGEKTQNDVVAFAVNQAFSNTSVLDSSDPQTVITLSPEILFTEDPNLNEVSVISSKNDNSSISNKRSNSTTLIVDFPSGQTKAYNATHSYNEIFTLALDTQENLRKSLKITPIETHNSNLTFARNITSPSEPTNVEITSASPSLKQEKESENKKSDIVNFSSSTEAEDILFNSNVPHTDSKTIEKLLHVNESADEINITATQSVQENKNKTLKSSDSHSLININLISDVSHDLSVSPVNETGKNITTDNSNHSETDEDFSNFKTDLDLLLNTAFDINSTAVCHDNQFQCIDGSCYDVHERCNSVFNCFDHSDEENCLENTCFDNYQCLHDNVCLGRSFLCDGVSHCIGGDDEEGCENHTCGNNEFACGSESSKLCLPLKLRCDGHPDCLNHTDEINCTSECAKDSFHCPEKTCIPNLWKCDGKSDCLNGEDENDCGCEGLDQSPCNVGGCVPTFKLCDGLRQCPDGSDEWGCIRIDEETNKLQVRTIGERWSAVCGDNWTEEWTELVCEQLGLGPPLSSEAISTPISALIPRMKLSADISDISRSRRAPLQYFLTHGECANDSLVHISCKVQACGNWNAFGSEKLVINNQSSKELWPSLGLLIKQHRNASSDCDEECAASIITQTWILTSYSCLASSPEGFDVEKWAFLTGDSSLAATHPNTQLRYAKQIVIYPGAKRLRGKWVGDAALVRLQTPLKFSPSIQPICLPTTSESEDLSRCVVASWNRASGYKIYNQTSLSAQIMQIVQKTSLMSLDSCNSSYNGRLLATGHLCASFLQDKYTSCNSHEGSPLMCMNSEGFWELRGLLSHAGNCASFNLSSIFTDVKIITSWIFNNLGRGSSMTSSQTSKYVSENAATAHSANIENDDASNFEILVDNYTDILKQE